MLKRIKQQLTGTEEKKRLGANIFSLGVLQVANYILPLLTLPYLVRILGPEYFGLLAFATATIMYFMLITDYGFNLSATRQISIHRGNKDKINEIFSSVMVIKITLMMVSFSVMSLIVFGFDKFSQHWEIYFISFGIVVGNVIFPVWLFQGMERMKYISYINIGAKTFFTACTFIFVREQSDYLFVPLLTATGFIAAGIWSLYLVRKDFNVSFIWQSTDTLKFQLTEGWHVFLSTIAISIYTISTTFFLGLFTNNMIVGNFAAADKIIQVVKGLYQPVSQTIYPLMGRKIHEDRQAGLEFIRKTTWIIGVPMFGISVILFFMSEVIVDLLLGAQYMETVLFLKIMAFLPFIISLSNMFGVQTMLNLGYKQAFSHILVSAAVLGMVLSLVFVPIYEGLGSALIMLTVEIFVALMMWTYLKRRIANE